MLSQKKTTNFSKKKNHTWPKEKSYNNRGKTIFQAKKIILVTGYYEAVKM